MRSSLAVVLASFALAACGPDGPTAPGDEQSEASRYRPSVPTWTTARVPDFYSDSCLAAARAALSGGPLGGDSPECQERYSDWRASTLSGLAARGLAGVSLEPAMVVAPPTCSATPPDVVVSTLAELRDAVSLSAPGSVVGVAGSLDINSDGLDDVVVTAPGITITCATDGAELYGASNSAVLDVRAPDVRIEGLRIFAPFGDARRGASGVVVRADGGVVAGNDLYCDRTCIFFLGVDGGLAEDNHVSFPWFGVGAQGVANVVVRDNEIETCLIGCVVLLGTESVEATGNALSGCGDRFGAGCIWADATRGSRIEDNDIQGVTDAVTGALAIRVTGDFFAPTPVSLDAVIRNNRAAGSIGIYGTEGAVIADNRIDNCFLECLTLFASSPAEAIANTLTGGLDDFVGIYASEASSLVLSRNEVLGTFLSDGIAVEQIPDSNERVRVSGNTVDVQAQAGMVLSFLSDGVVEGNRVTLPGADPYSTGIQLFGFSSRSLEIVDGNVVSEFEVRQLAYANLFRNNRVRGAGVGLFVEGACSNTFVGNNLQANETPAVFALRTRVSFMPEPNLEFVDESGGTGANTLAGNATGVVEAAPFERPLAGNGYLDCDQNGTGDPNAYSGAGVSVTKGGLGHVIGEILGRWRASATD